MIGATSPDSGFTQDPDVRIAAALERLASTLETTLRVASEIAKQVTEAQPQQETSGEGQKKPGLQVTLPSQDEPRNLMANAVRLRLLQQAEPNSRTVLVSVERYQHYVQGEWSGVHHLVLDVPSLVRLRDFCTEVLERGTVRTALEATECKRCDKYWAPWLHGPQAGQRCPFCGEPVTVIRKEPSP